MTVSLAEAVDGFLEHKRSAGRKYHGEEAELRLLVRFATNRQVVGQNQLTPAVFDDFLASRSWFQPRSFNHLRGVVVCLLDWAVSQGPLETSPMHTSRRRGNGGLGGLTRMTARGDRCGAHLDGGPA